MQNIGSKLRAWLFAFAANWISCFCCSTFALTRRWSCKGEWLNYRYAFWVLVQNRVPMIWAAMLSWLIFLKTLPSLPSPGSPIHSSTVTDTAQTTLLFSQPHFSSSIRFMSSVNVSCRSAMCSLLFLKAAIGTACWPAVIFEHFSLSCPPF